MIFMPRPDNPFPEFIATYFVRCRAAFSKIVGIAGKWRFEDLVPGLSDFDTRFLVEEELAPEEWAAMSRAISAVHAELVRERPDWARILEHTPGINLSLDELDDPLHYSPQIPAWTWYGCTRGTVQRRIDTLASHWIAADELHHLKKFAQYWGPYRRGIDPPVNLGPFENKYALHSRYMHYFAPAIHSAVSICLRKNSCGKLEALRSAVDLFPSPGIVENVLAVTSCHYEIEDAYREDALIGTERQLAEYLDRVFQILATKVSVVDLNRVASPRELRRVLNSISTDPAAQFSEKAMFMRLMTGRLLFFSQTVPAFESEWLIRNELARLGAWSCHDTLTAFVRLQLNQNMSFERAIEFLTGSFLSVEESAAFQQVEQLSAAPIAAGEERVRARAIAERFELVQMSLDRLSRQLKAYRQSDRSRRQAQEDYR